LARRHIYFIGQSVYFQQLNDTNIVTILLPPDRADWNLPLYGRKTAARFPCPPAAKTLRHGQGKDGAMIQLAYFQAV